MKTGDILLCSGNGFLSKRIINYQKIIAKLNHWDFMLGEACNISHIAGLIHNGVDVSESTTLNDWCGKKGNQINPFVDWIQHYDGKVWLRELIIPEDYVFSIEDDINAAAELLLGMPYENGIPGALELFFAGIEWHWFRQTFKIGDRLQTKTSIHCSEGWANILKNRDILHKDVLSNKMAPMFWRGGSKLDIHLINGFKYGKPILIKDSHTQIR